MSDYSRESISFSKINIYCTFRLEAKVARRRVYAAIGKRFDGDRRRWYAANVCRDWPRASLRWIKGNWHYTSGCAAWITKRDHARWSWISDLRAGEEAAQWTETKEWNRESARRAEGVKRKEEREKGWDVLTFDDSINAAHCRRRKEGEVGERHPSTDILGVEIWKMMSDGKEDEEEYVLSNRRMFDRYPGRYPLRACCGAPRVKKNAYKQKRIYISSIPAGETPECCRAEIDSRLFRFDSIVFWFIARQKRRENFSSMIFFAEFLSPLTF